ncbi:MAG: DHHA1 domain-containing protein [Gemmatimonas sp.]
MLFATAADTALDAGQLLKAALQSVGGRGGGAPRVAQGAVADPASLPSLALTLGFPG